MVEAGERKLADKEKDIGRQKTELDAEVGAEARRQVKELIPEMSKKVTDDILLSPDFDIEFLREVV